MLDLVNKCINHGDYRLDRPEQKYFFDERDEQNIFFIFELKRDEKRRAKYFFDERDEQKYFFDERDEQNIFLMRETSKNIF